MSLGSKERGFTLIEIFVALAIVALGSVAVYAKLAQSAHTARITQQKTLANWIAMNQLAELRLNPGLPNVGVRDGDVEYANGQWRYEIDIQETPSEGLRRAEIRVGLSEDPDTTIATLTGFVGQSNATAGGRSWDRWRATNAGTPTVPNPPSRPPQPNKRDAPR